MGATTRGWAGQPPGTAGDAREADVAVRLRALEAHLDASPAVAGTVLSLSAPDEPTIET